MLTEFLKQFVHERPLMVMMACWIEDLSLWRLIGLVVLVVIALGSRISMPWLPVEGSMWRPDLARRTLYDGCLVFSDRSAINGPRIAVSESEVSFFVWIWRANDGH